MEPISQSMAQLNQLVIRYTAQQPKDSAFIVKWMDILAKNRNDSIQLWRMIIKDSQFIIIDLPNYELNYNFASFVQDALKNCSVKKCAPLLEQFCIQAITNNPQILENRYYVGNGGYPLYEMLASFLIRGEINWHVVDHEIELCCYNILKFWIEQQTERNSFFVPRSFYLVYSQQNVFFIPKAFRLGTITLLLETFFFCLSKHDDLKNMSYSQFQNQFFNGHHDGQTEKEQNRSEMKNWIFNFNVPNLLANIFQVLNANIRRINRWGHLHLEILQKDIQHYETVQLPKAQQQCWLILEMIDGKHAQLLNLYDQKILQKISKIISQKVFIKVCQRLPNFKRILFSQSFIFKILHQNHFPLIYEMWADKEHQKIISEMRKNGKNILETVCESFGLTHKIIIVLWSSGLFSELPQIRNKKSKQIVLKHFQ